MTTVCNVAPLIDRRHSHLLTFMSKEKGNKDLLKKHQIVTRLHTAPVFATYKPNNEKAKLNILYRGAIGWNSLPEKDRNLDHTEFKKMQKRNLLTKHV